MNMHWEKLIQDVVVVRRAIAWKRLAISCWIGCEHSQVYRQFHTHDGFVVRRNFQLMGMCFDFYKNNAFQLLLTEEFLFIIRGGSLLINQKFKMNGSNSFHLSFVVLDVLSPCLAFNSNKNALWKELYKT